MLRSPQDSLNKVSPGLLLPQEKKIVLPDAVLPGPSIRLSGKFKLTVRRHGLIIKETDWFSNMILDQGLDFMGLAASGAGTFPMQGPFRYCHVGSGTLPPAASQTQLVNYIAGAGYSTGTGSISQAGSPTWVATGTQPYTFAQGAIVGTIAEVGIGIQQANGNLTARALIVDGGGTPTPITLTAIDQLTVTYSCSLTPQVNPLTGGTVVLDGVTYGYTVYPHYLTSRTSATNTTYGLPEGITSDWRWCGLSGSTSNFMIFYPAGTPVPADVATRSDIPGPGSTSYSNGASYTYNVGDFFGTSTFIIPPSVANTTGGIQGIRAQFFLGLFWGAQYFYYNFLTPIPKDNTKRLTLQFRMAWSR